jgi:hypothetical protein
MRSDVDTERSNLAWPPLSLLTWAPRMMGSARIPCVASMRSSSTRWVDQATVNDSGTRHS